MLSSLFGFVEEATFPHWQEINRETVLDLALSLSNVASLDDDARAAKLDEVLAFYDDYGRGMDGMQLPYDAAASRPSSTTGPEHRDRRRGRDVTSERPEPPRTVPTTACCSSTSDSRHRRRRRLPSRSMRVFRRGHLGTESDRATFRTLHTASLASPALREGLTVDSAERSIRHLRGPAGHAGGRPHRHLDAAGVGRRRQPPRGPGAASSPAPPSSTAAPGSPTRATCPATSRTARSGTPSPAPWWSTSGSSAPCRCSRRTPPPGLVRAADEVAKWVSGQLELAQLDASRTQLMEAEVRALRAQISPHFIYNSLGAIAAFVRTDPDRARELLLEFADFTRYSFRSHGEFTTLAEELRSVERYLLLEQARFGDRLRVTLRIAPEVLPVAVPFLCIQPLVENAVRHGIEGAADKTSGSGQITIVARDLDQECVIEVEDDGVGEDPEKVRRALAGDAGARRRRPGQRRRPAAQHVRRRLRPGG